MIHVLVLLLLAFYGWRGIKGIVARHRARVALNRARRMLIPRRPT